MSDSDGLLEELARLPSYHHPTASPDGTEVAVYYDESGRNELVLIDVETGERTQLSDGEVPRNARWPIQWSADGERVYFHRDEGGNEQNDVYAIDRDGTVEAIIEQDGQLTLADTTEEFLLYGANTDGQQNLYRCDLADGTTTKLTDYDRAVHTGVVSPDNTRIAYATNESEDFDNVDAYVMNADGSDARNLEIGETGAEAALIDWHPDGDRLLVADDSTDLGRVGIHELDDETVTWFGEDEYEERPVTFLPGGDRFLALRTAEAAMRPVCYDVDTGEQRVLDLPDGVASIPRGEGGLLADDRVLVSHTTPDRRPELVAYDLTTDESSVLLDASYGSLDPDKFADAEYFRFSSDGVADTEAAAVELEPAEELEIGALLYDSGRRPSPLIVNPHGGPRAADMRSFDLYTQFLVSRGCSVLQVNYRGSTGRGRTFRRHLHGDWGGAEQADVASAVEHVLETRDWIDDDRVVVFGGSYGGYSTYWQVVQYPELYDAGIAWIGLTDLEDMYENTMPHFRTELMERYLGTPEENPELYEHRSPITYTDNLDCPLLMVHGVNDRRVPLSQAELFRESLLEHDYDEDEHGDFEYVELGEEGHASTDIHQKIRLFRTLDDFLERRIGTTVEPSP